MKLLSKKIPGGKFIKVKYSLENGIISYFKLYGDFFLYPEFTLEIIEKKLLGVRIVDISRIIQDVLKKTSAQFIGVSPQNIQNVLEEDQKNVVLQ